jgi:predicted ArsR family transcriptional regulator
METSRKGPAGKTVDITSHKALGSAVRVTILQLVRDAEGGLSAAEVAARTGQHLTTTRVHLDRLATAGHLVKARASGGQIGRPAWRYRTATADPAPAPAPYRALAAALLDHLSKSNGDTRTLAAQAGMTWGHHLAAAARHHDDPTDTVIEVLRGLGFDPQRQPATADAGTVEVRLPTCPFLDLVGQNPDAMCGLHLGVVRGVLDEVGASSGGAVLEPFGAPAACVVRLQSAGHGGSPAA